MSDKMGYMVRYVTRSIFQYVYVDHDSNLEPCVEVVVLIAFYVIQIKFSV